MNESTNIHWYALRVTQRRELALKEYLDAESIENFIPMHYEYAEKNERRVRKLVPTVRNLVFIHSSRSHIDEIKESQGLFLPIRYIMNREHHCPVVVSDSQMCHFMAVILEGVSHEHKDDDMVIDTAMAMIMTTQTRSGKSQSSTETFK